MGLDYASDLCRIIDRCAKRKVSELIIGDIHVVFTPRDHATKKPTKAQTRAVEQEAKEQVREERSRDDLEHLKLSDPLAYEQEYLSAAGELEGEATYD